MVITGCDKNKSDPAEDEPMKMSAGAGASCATGECGAKADKAAK